MKRSLRMGIAVVGLAAFFTWQYLHKSAPDTPPKQAPVAAASVKTPVKPSVKQAPPRTWTLGSLTLTACNLKAPDTGTTTAAWCADVPVPENRADPASRTTGTSSGRSIKLHLAVIRSDAAVTPDDMLVLLAGGPGQAATQTWAGVAPALHALLKHRNVLLLDQRGTGHSNPLTCPQQDTKMTATVADQPATIRKQTAACLQQVRTHADPRFYTTTDAVADLEAIRRKLGSPKFDLVGISYGTRVAQQFAMRHPKSVRSMILDSVVPNTLILGESFADNLDSALKKSFAACTATPACKKRFGNPYQTLLKLRDALQKNPRQVSFRDPVSYKPRTATLDDDTLAGLVRLFAYTPETAALLPLSIDDASKGDAAPLMGQARIIEGDLGASLNAGMSMSVICAEDAAQLKVRPQDADTLLGNRLIEGLKAQCSVWPHGSMPADFHQPLKSAIPTLLMAGERDPVTPPRYAKAVAKGLSDSRVLVVKGQGHNVIARGCMPSLVTRFVKKLHPEKLNARCLKRMRAIPAFLNFNGARP